MFDPEALAVLAGSMLLMQSLYHPVTRFMTWVFGSKYTSLRTFEQQYCVKNTIKALVLGLLTPTVVNMLWGIAMEQEWGGHGRHIRLIGSTYAATDIVALSKFGMTLPVNTFLHHSCVLVFGVLNLFMDYEQMHGPWRHMAILAALSIPTYLVNIYLAFRRLNVHNRLLARTSLLVYVPFVLCNIVYQGNVVMKYILVSPMQTTLFGSMVLTVFIDDLKLMGHLWRESLNK